MGSIAEGSLEHHDHFHCKVPISGPELLDKPSLAYGFIDLCQSERDLAMGHNVILKSEPVMLAWAILLKSYTGSGLTSFATYYDATPLEANGELLPSAVRASKYEGSLVQCRLDEQSLLHDIHVVKLEHFCGHDNKCWSVNTAVLDTVNARKEIANNDHDVLVEGVHNEFRDYVSFRFQSVIGIGKHQAGLNALSNLSMLCCMVQLSVFKYPTPVLSP